MLDQESKQVTAGLQIRDLAVEVEAVDRFDREADMCIQEGFDRGQGFELNFHAFSKRA